MIIDAGIIIGLIATGVVIATIPMVILSQIRMAKNGIKLQELAKQQALLADIRKPTNEVGLVTEDIEITFMTEDEHLTHLKVAYPNAWKDYESRHISRAINSRGDRYISRLLLAYERGEVKAEIKTEHTLDFANGDSIWISNKYYGYGHLYRSVHAPHCIFDSDFTVTPYTFMRIVDLEERLSDPILNLTPIKVEH